MTSQEPQRSDRGWVGRALASVARLPRLIPLTLEGWREKSRLRREFGTLRDYGELERALSDCGIAASDVDRLMRAHPRTPQQLAAMMQRLGIDRAQLPRTAAMAEVLRAMEWQCGECADWRKCRGWLASPDATESHHAFCPNADVVDRLRRDEAAAAMGSAS